MRISDWSSDVCSSDLHFGSQAHVVGIDREPSQIDTSKRENPSPNIEYRVGDLKDYLEQLSGYDLIYGRRSEEHTSELQSLMRISYAVFCLKKKKKRTPLRPPCKHSPCQYTTHKSIRRSKNVYKPDTSSKQ